MFIYRIKTIIPLVLFLSSVAVAQTTSFTYQGTLTDAGSPANGTYLLQFKLFDAANAGSQVGSTITDLSVTATNGVFSTSLDFGAVPFSGANRFLEMAVKKLPGDPYTVLAPRQQILSVPYSIKSKSSDDATQLGGLSSTLYVQQDLTGNVSIGGNLTVSGSASYNIVNAQTQYNFGGQRILSSSGSAVGPSNLFVGLGAGQSTTPGVPTANSGTANTFVGINSGLFNTTGNNNSFVGLLAGGQNTIGNANCFFGEAAGWQNVSGNNNSFFGVVAGQASKTSDNSYFGAFAGANNETGGGSNSFFGAFSGIFNRASENSFFGTSSGRLNTTGIQNSFFGFNAGNANTTGSNNSFFGYRSGQSNTGANNAFFGDRTGLSNTDGIRNAFFGSAAGRANTSGSNNSFFGTAAGENNITGFSNSFFGDLAGVFSDSVGNSFFGSFSGGANTSGGANAFFGNASGAANTTGSANSFFGDMSGYDFTTTNGVTTGSRNTFIGRFSGKLVSTGSDNTFIGSNTTGTANLSFATVLGAGASVTTDNTVVLGRGLDTVQIPGALNVTGALNANGSNLTNLNASNITSGTLSNGRLGLIPTANIADSAVTAAKIATGQVVKSLNGLTDSVTLAAGANITITPAGNTLTIASTGGGGGNPILNQTTLQTSANFNVDGTGRANIFNANTQFNISGNRVLTATSESGTANLFAGFSAGASTTGGFNALVGTFAGQHITTGVNNSFFGVNAGGGEGSTGNDNVFIGNSAGFADGDGSRLTYIGTNTSNAPGFALTNSTAIGANARVTQNNSLVLGGITGVNGGTDTNVGIGTTAPKAKLDVTGGNLLVGSPGQGIILKSPNGATCRLLSIDNAGAIVLSSVTCP